MPYAIQKCLFYDLTKTRNRYWLKTKYEIVFVYKYLNIDISNRSLTETKIQYIEIYLCNKWYLMYEQKKDKYSKQCFKDNKINK